MLRRAQAIPAPNNNPTNDPSTGVRPTNYQMRYCPYPVIVGLERFHTLQMAPACPTSP